MKKLKKTSKERLNDTIHEMAQGLYDIGAIDGITMREYQSLRIPEVPDFCASEIKLIRLKERLSQPVFAKYLNTTVHTIRDWEQGKKHPQGTSLALLNLVSKKGINVLV